MAAAQSSGLLKAKLTFKGTSTPIIFARRGNVRQTNVTCGGCQYAH